MFFRRRIKRRPPTEKELLDKRIKQNRRLIPGMMRSAHDYFRSHPELCRKEPA